MNMRKPIKIGEKQYDSKKDAIKHYRTILNSYDFGQSLNDHDFDDLLDLLEYDDIAYSADIECLEDTDAEMASVDIGLIPGDESAEDEITIEDIKIARVQFNTKCFEVFYSDSTSQYISYLMIINNTKFTAEKLFYIACRSAIHNDIRAVKQEFFDQHSIKGQVKCQETEILSKWTELVVDHRQPNTFSVIVDRFKEVNRIDIETIEYSSNDQNLIVFKERTLSELFRKYHKEKASLRIVRRECNSGRSGLARIKRTSKDLTVK